jgi:hypothetical protein
MGFTAAYDVMLRCWAHRPTDRPSFHELRAILLDLFMMREPNLRDKA